MQYGLSGIQAGRRKDTGFLMPSSLQDPRRDSGDSGYECLNTSSIKTRRKHCGLKKEIRFYEHILIHQNKTHRHTYVILALLSF